MVTCVTRSEMPSFKVKIKFSQWLLFPCLFFTRYNQIFPSCINSAAKEYKKIVQNLKFSSFVEISFFPRLLKLESLGNC